MSRVSLSEDVVAEVIAKKLKADADVWFAGKVAEGFESEDGIKLGLDESDITLLTGNFILAKEAANLELDIPPVIDTDGVPHELTIEELTALMLEYGAYRASLSAEYVNRQVNVEE